MNNIYRLILLIKDIYNHQKSTESFRFFKSMARIFKEPINLGIRAVITMEFYLKESLKNCHRKIYFRKDYSFQFPFHLWIRLNILLVEHEWFFCKIKLLFPLMLIFIKIFVFISWLVNLIRPPYGSVHFDVFIWGFGGHFSIIELTALLKD